MNSQNSDFNMELIKKAPQSYCLEIKGSLELLKQLKEHIQKTIIREKVREPIDFSIQRKWCSLFMNLFLKSLKSRKLKSPLLQQLLAYREDMPSQQKKFEQGYLVSLLKNETEIGRDFRQQWLKFLELKELKDSIKNSKKIHEIHKNKYIDLIDKVIEQSKSKQPFHKFMSKLQAQLQNQNNENNNGNNIIDPQFQSDNVISPESSGDDWQISQVQEIYQESSCNLFDKYFRKN